MIRKLGLGVVLVAAFIVSGCSGALTPAPKPAANGGSLSPALMTIKFRVAGQMNFSKYDYVVVFNTTGNGVTPLPLGQQNSFAGYSFAFVVSGAGGTLKATALQCYRPPGVSDTLQPTYLPIVVTPQQLQFTPNSNGQANEFTVAFDPNITRGFGTPSSPNWQLNMFVAKNGAPAPSMNLVPIDSLGVGGATDTTYVSPFYDTRMTFDVPIIAYIGAKVAGGDPNAQIAQSEIENNP